MKKFGLYTAIGLVLMAGVSCKQALDLSPTDSIKQEDALKNVQDLEKGLLGAYGGMDGEAITSVGALMSDEARLSKENRGQGQFLYKWTQSTNDGSSGTLWASMYKVIDRANRVLEVIDNIEGKTPAENVLKAQIKGELLGVRAFAHFELWRWYNGSAGYNASALAVPYMLKSANTKPPRPTNAEFMPLLEKDLADARTLIPDTASNITRLTRTGIIALQARVALYKEEWTKAGTFAGEAISRRALTTDWDAYGAIWKDAVNGEVIFKLKRVSGSVNTTWQDSNDDVFFGAAYKLYNSFDRANDVRFTVDISVQPNRAPKDTLLVGKYNTPSRIVDIKLLRASEMYLIRAEALAEAGSIASAATDLNTLRAARIRNYTPETFTTKDALIKAIILERFKELAYEGHRYFDLKRRKLPVERDADDAGGPGSNYQTLPVSSVFYLLPIPQSEIFANENMKQNPGYGQ